MVIRERCRSGCTGGRANQSSFLDVRGHLVRGDVPQGVPPEVSPCVPRLPLCGAASAAPVVSSCVLSFLRFRFRRGVPLSRKMRTAAPDQTVELPVISVTAPPPSKPTNQARSNSVVVSPTTASHAHRPVRKFGRRSSPAPTSKASNTGPFPTRWRRSRASMSSRPADRAARRRSSFAGPIPITSRF